MTDWKIPLIEEQIAALDAGGIPREELAIHHIIAQSTISNWLGALRKLFPKETSSGQRAPETELSKLVRELVAQFIRFVTDVLPDESFERSSQAIRFRDQCKEPRGAHCFEATLCNLPMNLLAGPRDRIQDPRGDIDLETIDRGGQRRGFSERALHLLAASHSLDAFLRNCTALEIAGNIEVPPDLAKDLEDAKAAFGKAARATKELTVEGKIPNVDNSLWRKHRDDESCKDGGKWMMKGAGLHRESAEDVGALLGGRAFLVPDTFQWHHTSIVRAGGRDLEVHFEVPVEATWHIFERHTYRNFAGDIRPVNSFWPPDLTLEQIWESIKSCAGRVALAVKQSFEGVSEERLVQCSTDYNEYRFPCVPGVFYIATPEYCSDYGDDGQITRVKSIHVNLGTVAPDGPESEKVSSSVLKEALGR